mgnify:CR=1 FL=1
MTNHKLIKTISDFLKEEERIAGADLYDTDTTEGYAFNLLAQALKELKK